MEIWIYSWHNTWDSDHYTSAGYFGSLEEAKIYYQYDQNEDLSTWENDYKEEYRKDTGDVQYVKFTCLKPNSQSQWDD
jgi:hypothetical protein